MTFVEELVPHLPEWLGRQRWFGAKGREVSAVEVASATSLTDAEPLLDLLVLAVSFADGGPVQHYHPLLGRRQADAVWSHRASYAHSPPTRPIVTCSSSPRAARRRPSSSW